MPLMHFIDYSLTHASIRSNLGTPLPTDTLQSEPVKGKRCVSNNLIDYDCEYPQDEMIVNDCEYLQDEIMPDYK